MNTYSIDMDVLAKAEEYTETPEQEEEGSGYAVEKAITKSVAKAKAVVATAKEKTKRTNTKTARATAIYKQHNGDKSAIINAYMTELGMSKAGATTYFYNAKKAA